VAPLRGTFRWHDRGKARLSLISGTAHVTGELLGWIPAIPFLGHPRMTRTAGNRMTSQSDRRSRPHLSHYARVPASPGQPSAEFGTSKIPVREGWYSCKSEGLVDIFPIGLSGAAAGKHRTGRSLQAASADRATAVALAQTATAADMAPPRRLDDS